MGLLRTLVAEDLARVQIVAPRDTAVAPKSVLPDIAGAWIKVCPVGRMEAHVLHCRRIVIIDSYNHQPRQHVA